jgi:surfeit locus 1 family protein
MLARWRAARLLWPTLLTLAALPVLIGLGTWQWERMEWKADLIGKLAERVEAEPLSYTSVLAEFHKSSPDLTTGDVEYMRVRVTGTYDHAQERHVYAPRSSGQGWNVFTLLKPAGNQPPVYINRGWVPDELKEPAARAEGQVTGPVTVTGLARLDEPKTMFAAPNDPKANRWYQRDTWALRWGEKGPPSQSEHSMMRLEGYAPFSIDAEAEPANPGGWPKGGTTQVRLPNSHLQYVATWYGLALTLIVIFIVFARQRLAEYDQKRLQP